jgi:hypothetical protein
MASMYANKGKCNWFVCVAAAFSTNLNISAELTKLAMYAIAILRKDQSLYHAKVKLLQASHRLVQMIDAFPVNGTLLIV